ncbi:MAG: DUF3592 domain-containing protein [Chloroflexota bacterium]|jgi:hypothetical protein
MNTQFYLIVLAVLMVAVSIFYGLKILSIYRRKSASANWPSTTGRVLSKDILSTRNSKTNSYSYSAEVTYNYTVPGGSFEKKLFLGSKGVRSQAEMLLNAVGETVQVRYNPEKPAEHISDHEKIMPSQIVAIIGSLILAVVLIGLAF